MTFLAMLTIVDPELNQNVRPSHLRYISDLYRQGKVLMAGPFGDGSGGLVIYHNVEEAEAKELAEADPVVQSGARTLKLVPWTVLTLPIVES